MYRDEITDELAAIVMPFGRVVPTASEEVTDEVHAEGMLAKAQFGRQMFSGETPEVSKLYGLGLGKLPLITLAMVGNSPNSEPVSKALAIAWNRLVDDCEAHLMEERRQQEEMIQVKRNESDDFYVVGSPQDPHSFGAR
jgi:hypothetical protein